LNTFINNWQSTADEQAQKRKSQVKKFLRYTNLTSVSFLKKDKIFVLKEKKRQEQEQ